MKSKGQLKMYSSSGEVLSSRIEREPSNLSWRWSINDVEVADCFYNTNYKVPLAL